MTDQDQARAEAAPALDAHTAATLAVNNEIDRQMVRHPNAMVAINPGPLVTAVMRALGGEYPRVPEWLEARTVGGAYGGGQAPEPTVRLDHADGQVVLTVEASDPDLPDPIELVVHVNPLDAEGWFLAGLSAVREARTHAE